MSQNQYFRAGTGAIIYNDTNEILLFSRTEKPEIWQLQQGGMDAGELVEETLWRELVEETGLTQNDFVSTLVFPDRTFYEYPPIIRERMKDPNCIGQTHLWFFLKLKPGTIIDLTKVTHPEFNDFKWSTFEELLSFSDVLKLGVYTKLSIYFKDKIVAN